MKEEEEGEEGEEEVSLKIGKNPKQNKAASLLLMR
jgi:hypothetical protein